MIPNEDRARNRADLAWRVLERFLRSHPIPWGPYALDLALEGAAAMYQATGEDRFASPVLQTARARGWFEEPPEGGQPPFTLLAFEAWRLSGEDRPWAQAFVAKTRRYRETIPRDDQGRVLHPKAESRGGGHAVLIDSLQEYAARMAKASWLAGGDVDLADECAEQFELHRTALRDPSTGLWHQGLGWEEKDTQVSPHAWSRGHGWLVRGLVESLLYLPEGEPADRVRRMLKETLAALAAVQDDEGMLHALLDLPADRSPGESSGTALVAGYTAIALAKGLIGGDGLDRFVRRALEAVPGCIGPDGTILSACAGPGPLSDADVPKYLDVASFPPDNEHGAGAILFALAGRIRLGRASH